MPEDLHEKIKTLPEKPGVYQFYNGKEEVVYIGKAKNLKKRVSSYFHKENAGNNKLKILVRSIARIEYVIVESETDALLLENNLIKKYQPRYNVQLKDDKSFPWICIKNEPFPRVFPTRNLVKDGSQYYGPYTSMNMVRTLLGLVRKLYPLRTCNLKLSRENIEKGHFKPCLEYHIGNCKAPCIGLHSEEEYEENILHIKNIIKGNISSVIQYLYKMMNDYSSNYKFEEAQLIKEKIEVLEKYQAKSTIVNPNINNVDVFSIENDKNYAFVNYLKISNGGITQSHTVEIQKKLDEKENELLNFAINAIKNKLETHSDELIVPFTIGNEFNYKKIIVPKKGDKKKLLELSQRNASYYRIEKLKNQEAIKNRKQLNIGILEKIKEDIKLSSLPKHIECFDISNIQGTNAVASCVVFRNARPANKEYRHYNIKSVTGPDDFASMKEVVFRRYKRLVEENQALPQLIIIDGGKGQLAAAKKSLDMLEINDIAIISIAKRLEELYFPNDPIPLYLDKNSVTLKVIQHLRNEAHRFGLNFHRDKRSQNFINSELRKIEGIGEKTNEKLLHHFKSIDNLKNADIHQIAELVGMKKADIIVNYFNRR